MDDELIERLLSGDPAASAEAPELSMLLAAASAPTSESGPLAGESAALAAFRATHAAGPSRRKRMIPEVLASKVVGLAAVGALTLTGGVGVAAAADATGIAHNPVGSTVNDVVTGGNHGHGNGHANGHAKTQDSNQPTTDVQNNQDNLGSQVSDAAHSCADSSGHPSAGSTDATSHGECVSAAVRKANGSADKGQQGATTSEDTQKAGKSDQELPSQAKTGDQQDSTAGDGSSATESKDSTTESTEPKDTTTEGTEQPDQQDVTPQGGATTGSDESSQNSHAKSSH